LAGYAYPSCYGDTELDTLDHDEDVLRLRLILASHFAQHLRFQLEEIWGYTCTIGVSTSKLLSKLIGNVNKPHAQTTLMPPYVIQSGEQRRVSNVTLFIDALEVGKLPGIGFKTANKLREFVLQRPSNFDGWKLHENDAIRVSDVKGIKNLDASTLERILGGPGVPQGTGLFIWNLLHGIDNSDVAIARDIPKQISIEDSYTGLDDMGLATVEMTKLAKNLIKRMRIDLLEKHVVRQGITNPESPAPRWLARPKSLRLSTRPRSMSSESNTRDFHYHSRISRTGLVPNFLFSTSESVDVLASKLVQGYLIPLFRSLHPEKSSWNLSLINVAVTNMQEAGSEAKGAVGRDIEGMFRKQEATLREWTAYNDVADEIGASNIDMVNDVEMTESVADRKEAELHLIKESEDQIPRSSQRSQTTDEWIEEDGSSFEEYSSCYHCGACMPSFAMAAHELFHQTGD
jgi:DNA polymerase iota